MAILHQHIAIRDSAPLSTGADATPMLCGTHQSQPRMNRAMMMIGKGNPNSQAATP